ncbi:MAG: hypothetical protein WA414_19025, partial [Acidobacteriaceae bacterium]
MNARRMFLAASIFGLAISPGLRNAAASGPEPATAQAWLEHANALMNIREPSAAPFHMKVKFHALPGFDFSRKNKPGIVTGDGIYEETW